MKIAMPVWNGKISPVFDTASRLLVVELDGRKVINRFETFLEPVTGSRRCLVLQNLDVQVLICGAITRQIARLLAGSGIRVVAWISGAVDEVLEAYSKDSLLPAKFLMPGCRSTEGPGCRNGTRPGCPRRDR